MQLQEKMKALEFRDKVCGGGWRADIRAAIQSGVWLAGEHAASWGGRASAPRFPSSSLRRALLDTSGLPTPPPPPSLHPTQPSPINTPTAGDGERVRRTKEHRPLPAEQSAAPHRAGGWGQCCGGQDGGWVGGWVGGEHSVLVAACPLTCEHSDRASPCTLPCATCCRPSPTTPLATSPSGRATRGWWTCCERPRG